MLSRNPFSLFSLASWLRTKSGSYYYGSPTSCFLHQYLTAMGEEPTSVGPYSWSKRVGQKSIPLSPEFAYIASGHLTSLLPDAVSLRLRGHTFEDALRRCEALIERGSPCSV